jgi:hypothetical protein
VKKGNRFASIAAWLALPVAAMAQLTGSIEGMVTDPSGRVVSGVQIVVMETSTNESRRLATDREGRYVAADLAPGVYRVEAAFTGFQKKAEGGLVLTAGRTLRCDVTLQIGSTTELVHVSAEAAPVDAAAGAWGESVERRQLDMLPLNGRDMFDLASQESGASAPASAVKTLVAGVGVHVSVNGSRPNENAFRLDGVYINDATGAAPASAAGSLLGLEAIAELHLVTGPFSAEYGRSDGGVVTAVSKSGANDFHGSLYEYLRNSDLDAKNYFDTAGELIPAFHRNQFGALVGGPAWRDRIFFLANYEGLRIASSNTTIIDTPDAQARQGKLPVNGVLKQVTVSSAIIPYLALYPLPNGPDLGGGIGEFITPVPTTTSEDHATGRLDLAATDRLHLNGRYTFDDSSSTVGDAFGFWQYPSTSRFRILQTGGQYIESANVIHEFHAAYSQIFNEQTAITENIPPTLSFVPGQPMGVFSVTGLTEFGGENGRTTPRDLSTDDLQLNYVVTRVTGAQKLTAGTGFDRIWFDQVGNQDSNGYYAFSSLQSFLTDSARALDLMTPGSNTYRHWRLYQFSAFVQDDVRLTNRLSVGFGVRYETATVPTERNDQIATLPDPLHDASVTLGGPLYINPAKWNFAPRASLSWDVFGDGRTVLRSGAGIFYDLLGTRELVVAGFRMPPFYNRAVISNPTFPDALAALGNNTTPPSVDGLDYRPDQPYVAQYQMEIEHAVGEKGVVELGYAGSRGIHLMGDIANINTTQPAFLGGGQLYFPANAPAINPHFGQIGIRTTNFDSNHNSLTVGASVNLARGLRAQSKFTWSKSIDDDSIATYSEFYTEEKVPTVFDYRANRGRSDFDCPLLFAANFTYQLPQPGEQTARILLGGWQLSGLAQVQSGNPFNPTVGFDNARLLGTSSDLGQRPNLVLGQPLIEGVPRQYFNPFAFSLPPAGYLGDLGRNVLLGPGLAIASLAVERSFLHREAGELRVRGEVFNMTNHPNFQIPSGTSLYNSAGSSLGTAGQITATTTSSRQVQISARLTF